MSVNKKDIKTSVLCYITNHKSKLVYNDDQKKFKALIGSRSCNEFPIEVDIAAGGWCKENEEQHKELISSNLNRNHHVTVKYGRGRYKNSNFLKDEYDGKRRDDLFICNPSLYCIDFDDVPVKENKLLDILLENKFNFFITPSKNSTKDIQKYHVYILLKNPIESINDLKEFDFHFRNACLLNNIHIDNDFVPQGVIHRTKNEYIKKMGCYYGDKYAEDIFSFLNYDPKQHSIETIRIPRKSKREKQQKKNQPQTDLLVYNAIPDSFFDRIFELGTPFFSGFDSTRFNHEISLYHIPQMSDQLLFERFMFAVRHPNLKIEEPLVKEGTRHMTLFKLFSSMGSYFIYHPVETWSRILSFYIRGGIENPSTFTISELKNSFKEAMRKNYIYVYEKLTDLLNQYESLQQRKLYLAVRLLYSQFISDITETYRDELKKIHHDNKGSSKRKVAKRNKLTRNFIIDKFFNILILYNFPFMTSNNQPFDDIITNQERRKETAYIKGQIEKCIDEYFSIYRDSRNGWLQNEYSTAAFWSKTKSRNSIKLSKNIFKKLLDDTYIQEHVYKDEFTIEMFFSILQNNLQLDERFFIREKNMEVNSKKTLELRRQQHNEKVETQRMINLSNTRKYFHEQQNQPIEETRDLVGNYWEIYKEIENPKFLPTLLQKKNEWTEKNQFKLREKIDFQENIISMTHDRIFREWKQNQKNLQNIINFHRSNIVDSSHHWYKKYQKREVELPDKSDLSSWTSFHFEQNPTDDIRKGLHVFKKSQMFEQNLKNHGLNHGTSDFFYQKFLESSVIKNDLKNIKKIMKSVETSYKMLQDIIDIDEAFWESRFDVLEKKGNLVPTPLTSVQGDSELSHDEETSYDERFGTNQKIDLNMVYLVEGGKGKIYLEESSVYNLKKIDRVRFININVNNYNNIIIQISPSGSFKYIHTPQVPHVSSCPSCIIGSAVPFEQVIRVVNQYTSVFQKNQIFLDQMKEFLRKCHDRCWDRWKMVKSDEKILAFN